MHRTDHALLASCGNSQQLLGKVFRPGQVAKLQCAGLLPSQVFLYVRQLILVSLDLLAKNSLGLFVLRYQTVNSLPVDTSRSERFLRVLIYRILEFFLLLLVPSALDGQFLVVGVPPTTDVFHIEAFIYDGAEAEGEPTTSVAQAYAQSVADEIAIAIVSPKFAP